VPNAAALLIEFGRRELPLAEFDQLGLCVDFSGEWRRSHWL
jgi:hypothetical protein